MKNDKKRAKNEKFTILKEGILNSQQMYPYTKNPMSMTKNEANMQVTRFTKKI